jgi:hypothetical protein
MVRRLSAVVLGIALVSFPLALAVPTAAEAARSVGPAAGASVAPAIGHEEFAGYLWSTSAVTPSLNLFYAYNSAFAGISVGQIGIGEYLATFGLPGSVAAPTVEMSAYDSRATCQVNDLETDSTSMTVVVFCYTYTGKPANSRFDLVVGNASKHPAGLIDYSYYLHGHLRSSYNSSHHSNKITGLGTGRYAVTFGGPATHGVTGTAQVTTGGSGGGNCVLAGWHGSAAGEVVDVNCFSASGKPHKESFFAAYDRHSNVTGMKDPWTADAFANHPTTHSYVPAVQDDSTPGARVSVKRTGKGDYEVRFAKSGGPYTYNGGDVQVIPVGTGDTHCDVGEWDLTASPVATIQCFSNSGHHVDSEFAVQWIIERVIV